MRGRGRGSYRGQGRERSYAAAAKNSTYADSNQSEEKKTKIPEVFTFTATCSPYSNGMAACNVLPCSRARILASWPALDIAPEHPQKTKWHCPPKTTGR